MPIIYRYLILYTRTCAQVGEVGVIEKVQLTNFMCHRHMLVTFSPNVNFVLGRNGSKSFKFRLVKIWPNPHTSHKCMNR